MEDERRLAAALQRGLETEGFAVDVAHDGIAGLRQATQSPYDIVVLDIMLPGLNGYRVCSKLRAGGCRSGILMLTAKDGEWDEAEALDTGADDFLSKPFSYVVLVARLRALARRLGERQPRVVRLGDLTLDLGARTCVRSGEQIRLTAREFAVLEHLALHAGDVVSKRDILDEVWDEHYDGDANVVEVHVSALRRKIDAPYGRAAVQTVRGVGYRLAVDGG